MTNRPLQWVCIGMHARSCPIYECRCPVPSWENLQHNLQTLLGFEQAWTPILNLTAPLCKLLALRDLSAYTWPSSVLSQICKTGNSRQEALGSNYNQYTVQESHFLYRVLLAMVKAWNCRLLAKCLRNYNFQSQTQSALIPSSIKLFMNNLSR